MKTKPDEATLTLWMDGELEGDELVRMEAWAKNHPDILAEKETVRSMNSLIREHMPESIEPPYADFFNQRILRHANDGISAQPVGSAKGESNFWRWLAAPLVASAMALCFYMGTQMGGWGDRPASPIQAHAMTTVYTPDSDVSSDIFNSEGAGATIIVLEGLEDIPDDLDMVYESVHRDPGTMVRTTRTIF